MILFFFLTVFLALFILVCIGILIFGVVKKRKNIWITAAAFLVVAAIGCICTSIIYSKKVYAYVKSNEFQQDVKKGAELGGQTAGSAASGISKGLSSTIDDEAINNLAKKSASILATSIKTIASTVDSVIGNKNIFIDRSLADEGFELGRASERYGSTANDLGIFIEYKKDFKGKLKLANYDQAGKKIDIAENEIIAKAGQEKVEVFSFKHSDLGLTTYYILSKVD